MAGVMERLFGLMAERKASDLYLSPGSPVHARIDGTTVPVGTQKLDATTIRGMLSEIVDEARWRRFAETRELNFGHGVSGVGSFRVSVFQQRGTPAAVIRYVPGEVPRFDGLGLPPVLLELVTARRGLVLMVGATGSGKSTTLAAMIDHRNETRTGHILTIEDPIEFNFRNKRSIVNQREVGTDADSLEIALKNALRQAPDCIMIGEIRDAATMTAAMAYAQSGHLVLATLHANNAYHCLNRIVSFFAPEHRHALLADLSATLRGIVSQRLLRAVDGGRIPAVEVLVNTTHVAELIAEGRMTEVKEAMEKSLAPGSQTFEQALLALVRAQRVRRDEALAAADSATNLLWMLDNTAAHDGMPGGAGGASPTTGVSGGTVVTGTAGAAAVAASAGPNPPDGPGKRPAPPDDGPSFSDFLLNI